MTWRAASREDRTIAWLWAGVALGAVALQPLWLRAAPFLPTCAWHAWTGFACPGCGTTRAMLHLARLDPAGALRMNPMASAGAMAFLVVGPVAPVWLALGGRVPVPAPGPKPRVMTAGIVAVLANWAWLVATGV